MFEILEKSRETYNLDRLDPAKNSYKERARQDMSLPSLILHHDLSHGRARRNFHASSSLASPPCSHYAALISGLVIHPSAISNAQHRLVLTKQTGPLSHPSYRILLCNRSL